MDRGACWATVHRVPKSEHKLKLTNIAVFTSVLDLKLFLTFQGSISEVNKYFFCCCYCLVAQSCLTLQSHGLQSTRLLCPWDFPGKNAGVGCHFLLQGVFSTPGSNLCPLHCRQSPALHADSLLLSHQGFLVTCIGSDKTLVQV